MYGGMYIRIYVRMCLCSLMCTCISLLYVQKCAVTLPKVRQSVLSVFQQVLFHRDHQLDVLIVNQLGKLGANTGVSVSACIYNSVVFIHS